MSSSEKKILREMKGFKDKLRDFHQALEQMKAKQNYQKAQVCYMNLVHIHMRVT
jgi:hypothetical protein